MDDVEKGKKMRVAIIVSHPIQHFCPQYASFSRVEGINIKAFFASAQGLKKYIDPSFKQEISWDNLRLEEFDHVFMNGDAVIAADKNIDAITVEKELSLFKPDVVIIYGYFQKLQRRVHKWAYKNGVDIAYISDSELRHQRSFIKRTLMKFLVQKYFSRISYFLSVGDANEQFYLHHGVDKKQIIRMHFPIDIEQYKIAYQKRDLLGKNIREKYAIPEHETVVSVVGKLVTWKNQDHIIKAMQLLETEGIKVHLFIIGSGDMEDVWKKDALKLNTSKVYFTGFVSPAELPAFYAASDIYIHPASVEPHSIAVSEAIYMGCAIIISDTCGSYGENDDVQKGKNGFVYRFGNINDLKGKMKTLITTPQLRNQMGSYSHSISEKYQYRAHRQSLIELVQHKKISVEPNGK